MRRSAGARSMPRTPGTATRPCSAMTSPTRRLQPAPSRAANAQVGTAAPARSQTRTRRCGHGARLAARRGAAVRPPAGPPAGRSRSAPGAARCGASRTRTARTTPRPSVAPGSHGCAGSGGSPRGVAPTMPIPTPIEPTRTEAAARIPDGESGGFSFRSFGARAAAWAGLAAAPGEDAAGPGPDETRRGGRGAADADRAAPRSRGPSDAQGSRRAGMGGAEDPAGRTRSRRDADIDPRSGDTGGIGRATGRRGRPAGDSPPDGEEGARPWWDFAGRSRRADTDQSGADDSLAAPRRSRRAGRDGGADDTLETQRRSRRPDATTARTTRSTRRAESGATTAQTTPSTRRAARGEAALRTTGPTHRAESGAPAAPTTPSARRPPVRAASAAPRILAPVRRPGAPATRR